MGTLNGFDRNANEEVVQSNTTGNIYCNITMKINKH